MEKESFQETQFKHICRHNYRVISLLSVVGKIYARIVSDRLRVLTNLVVTDKQGGFRAGRGCVNQGFAVRQIRIREGDCEGQGEVCRICIFRECSTR